MRKAMSENDRAAFIVSQAACMVVEAMGMQAENKMREHRGEQMAYDSLHFIQLIEKYGMSHNSVIAYLNGEWKASEGK
jgi:hypothetical protein